MCTRSWALPLAAVVTVVASTYAQQPSARTPAPAPSASPSSVDQVRRATILLEVAGAEGPTTGSGVLVTSSGVIATAAHVIYGASRATARLATGEVFTVAGVLDYDERLDVALLLIPGFGLPAAPLGNSDSVSVGTRLLAIGAPLGLEQTVADGLLSAVRLDAGSKLFQVSIPVSHGSSGGPVLTEDGRVVAIVASGVRGDIGQNLNFAVPINYVRGKLAFVDGKTPTPLAQVAYGAGGRARGNGALMGDTTAAAGGAGGLLARVNADVAPDWRRLDGYEAYLELKGEGQIRVKSVIRVAVTADPDGRLVVERANTRRTRSQGLVAGIDLADDIDDVVYTVGSINKWTATVTRRPLAASVAAEANALTTEGSHYTYSVSGTATPRMGDAPPGVLPASLVGATIVALPESLPAQVRLWVLDPVANRAVPVTYTFAPTMDTVAFPLAAPGATCGPDATIIPTRLPARRVTVTFGVQRPETYAAAVHSPHIMVADGVKCLRVSGHAPVGPARPTPDTTRRSPMP